MNLAKRSAQLVGKRFQYWIDDILKVLYFVTHTTFHFVSLAATLVRYLIHIVLILYYSCFNAESVSIYSVHLFYVYRVSFI